MVQGVEPLDMDESGHLSLASGEQKSSNMGQSNKERVHRSFDMPAM
jgi:hypothetical protein